MSAIYENAVLLNFCLSSHRMYNYEGRRLVFGVLSARKALYVVKWGNMLTQDWVPRKTLRPC